MERSNFWTFLGLGLALGISLEVMKHPAAKTNVRLAGFTRFETLLAEGRQVNIPDEPKHDSKDSKKRAKDDEAIIPHQLSPEELPPTEALAAPTASPSPTPKPETPEEKKKREEAEKKKKEEQKKQQEKLQKEEQERQAKASQQQQQPPTGDDKKKEADPVGENPPSAPITTIQALPGNGSPDNPKTVAEWEAYLLQAVDYSRMEHFVRAYQTAEISSETYYTVIGDMLQDSRPDMHTLALTGLAATPSQTSFDMLINESTSDPFSSARSQALTDLSSYSRLENLRFLMNIITTSRNAASVLQAIRLVQMSARNTHQTHQGQVSTQSTQSQQATNTSLARFYQPFVTVLTTTSQSAQQAATVRSAARGALQDIQTLLSQLGQQPPSGTTPTGTAPTGTTPTGGTPPTTP